MRLENTRLGYDTTLKTIMASWIEVTETSDFPLQNLPYGIFSTKDTAPRIGVAIGDWVLDLKLLAQEGVFDDLRFEVKTLQQPTLNAYAALEKRVHSEVRHRLQKLLEKDTELGNVLQDNPPIRDKAFFRLNNVQMHLPMVIGNYTDFFVGLHHAVTVSKGSIRRT